MRLSRILRLSALPLLAALAAACAGEPEPPADAPDPLLYPGRLDATAPPRFRTRFETTAGDFVVEVRRSWSPRGADRFYNLVRNGFYDDTRIYRVVEGFMAQWGIHGDPVVDYQWRDELLMDDRLIQSNERGTIAFAKAGPNSRTTEVFVNYEDNPELDDRGFTPFGRVVEGMETVDAFHAGYGDGPPRGEGPYALQAQAQGNAYLDAEFPELDRILRATVLEDAP